MKRILIFAFVLTFLGALVMADNGWLSPPIAKAMGQGCTDDSWEHFYGFSLGPDYIYTQTSDSRWQIPRYLEAKRGDLNVVQFDIWARDDMPIYQMQSTLVPVKSVRRGDKYAFTDLTMQFSGMFWRHQPLVAGTPEGVVGGQPMVLEGRLGGWHFWDLKFGIIEDEGYVPLCDFSFLTYFSYTDE